MPRSILVPMDHSAPSKAALRHALTTYPDVELTVLHVIEPSVSGSYGQAVAPEPQIERAEERTEELFAEAHQIAEGVGDRAELSTELSTATERGSPARSICEFSRTNGVDHIVMGSHGRSGVKRLLLGSVAELVVRRATIPVTVVR